MKKLIQLILCFLLFGLSIWLIWPGRNEFGNPRNEVKIASCETSKSIVRLYQGDGGATVSYSWSITAQNKSSPFEWQVFYTYSSPGIESLYCIEDKVLALEGTKVITEISSGIISEPAIGKVPGFYKGESDFRYRNIFFNVSTYFGIITLGIAYIVLRQMFRDEEID